MPPMTVQTLTADIGAQVREIARALPYRVAIGVDPERIVWVEVVGTERIGVAFTPEDPDGPHWMIAIGRLDGSRVRQRDVRRIVDLVIGAPIPFEIAPSFDSAPHLTLVRVRAD